MAIGGALRAMLNMDFRELRKSEVQPQIIPTASSADRDDPGHRGGVLRDLIQDPANGLPRIPILRTPVNKPRLDLTVFDSRL